MRPFLALSLAVSLTIAGWSSDTPAWLTAVAALETPAYAKDAPAVVLQDDTTLEVDAQGLAVETHRYAIRVLHSSAFGLARGEVSYNGTSDKVTAADAWILRGKEMTTTKGKAEWIDFQLRSPGAAIDEIRQLAVTVSDKVLTGDVFGFETRLKMPLLVAQLQWAFGDRLPQVTQRFTVTLPPGVTLEHWESGAMPVTVTQPKANTWTWTLPEQPYRREEIAMPETAWTNAAVFARIRPSAAMRSATFRDFATWSDVARFFQELSTGQCDAPPTLANRAKELAAGDPQSPDTVEKVAAYVQKTRYVGINRGLRYGYGWRPRKASEVFASGYGDCKDKANLMVAMLGALGIKSHMTIAYLGRDKEVRPDFPSPAQFNHAIVAIEVPDTVTLPAAKDVAGLGRILFFDATNPYTLLGDLSVDLQGSYVYILDPRVNELTRLPELTSTADFRLERRVNLILSENGAMALEGQVTGSGQAGATLASKLESASLKRDLEKVVLAELSAGLRSTSVAEVKRLAEPDSPPRGFSFVAGVPRYLQQLSATSAVFKLDVLSRGYLPGFTEKQRNLPVAIDPVAVQDEVTLHLPAGYVVDEIPARAEVQSPYGSCTVEYTATADGLKLTRHVVLVRQQVPAADYAAVRKFFADLARADRGAVMLRKAG